MIHLEKIVPVTTEYLKKDETKGVTTNQILDLNTQNERDTASNATEEVAKKSKNALKKAKQRERDKAKKAEIKAQAIENVVNTQQDRTKSIAYIEKIEDGQVITVGKQEIHDEIPRNSFDEEEDEALKQMLESWNLDYQLTYFDFWGLHFNHLMNQFLKEVKSQSLCDNFFKEIREFVFKNFLGKPFMKSLSGQKTIFDLLEIKQAMEVALERVMHLVFAVPLSSRNRFQSEAWVKRMENLQRKMVRHLKLTLKVCSSTHLSNQIFCCISKFPYGYSVNSGSPAKCLDSLVSFAEYYSLLCQTLLNNGENPFKGIGKELSNLLEYMKSTKPQSMKFGEKFLYILKQLNQKVINLDPSWIMEKSVFNDIIRVFSSGVITPFFPSYMSEHDFVFNANNNIIITIENATTLRDRMPLKLNSSLVPTSLIEQIKEDHRNLFLNAYKELPQKDLHTCMRVLNLQKISTKEQIAPLIACFDPKRRLGELARALSLLREKHVKEIHQLMVKLNIQNKKERREIIENFKENCSACCQYLATYIVFLKDLDFLDNYDRNSQAILQGKSHMIPKELIDYMELEGLESLVFPQLPTEVEEPAEENSPDISDDDTEEFNSLALNEDDAKEDADEKEVSKKKEHQKISAFPSISRRNENIEWDSIAYPSKGKILSPKRSKQEKSDRQKRRKVMQRLQSYGCIPASGRGSHTKMYDRDKGHLKSVVPHHRTIKKGTLNSINKSTSK